MAMTILMIAFWAWTIETVLNVQAQNEDAKTIEFKEDLVFHDDVETFKSANVQSQEIIADDEIFKTIRVNLEDGISSSDDIR
jgi:hypothetical protein